MPGPDNSWLGDDAIAPEGYVPVRCLRCARRLFIPDDIWYDPDVTARQAAVAEHHAWLCPNPTPFAAALRAAQPPIRPWE